MRDGTIRARIRALRRQLEVETGADEGEPDRRFVVGALFQELGEPLEAARWYLLAARQAEDRGERRAAVALARLAALVAPGSLDALRTLRELGASPLPAVPGGMDG